MIPPVPQAHRPRTAVVGVDFSAAQNAGAGTWLAEGVVEGGRLRIGACCPASRLPCSATARDRCFAALRAYVRAHPQAVFGFDFPFGLPSRLVPDADWTAFVRAFAGRYPTPEGFRDACRAACGNREIKRFTDAEAQTPMCVYNLRLYRQTWHGIADILAPLVADGAISVPPMQAPDPAKPWLLEICPASTLKRSMRYPLQSGSAFYKDASPSGQEQRARLLDWRASACRVVVPPSLRPVVLADAQGDALDSIVAAEGAFRALAGPLYPPRRAAYAQEGMVFV